VRRTIVLIMFAALAAGTTAIAQDGGDPGAPLVRSESVLHLRGSSGCGSARGVTLRVTPPVNTTLGWLTVRINGRQIVRLTGIAGGASVTVRLPRGGARIATAAETLDGQQLFRARRYRACEQRNLTPPRPRRDRPPVIVGGGEA
jgi:hypothetical protein